MKESLIPIMIDFLDREVIVFGGGQVGLRKARTFAKAGAKVTVISEEFSRDFEKIDAKLMKKKVSSPDEFIKKAFMAIAATDDPQLNTRISESCRKYHVLCNVVDDPRSETYMPSIISRGPLTIGISTRGESPGLSKFTRKAIEKRIGPEFAQMARLQAYARNKLKNIVKSQPKRGRILTKILEDEEVWTHLRAKRFEKAKSVVDRRYLKVKV